MTKATIKLDMKRLELDISDVMRPRRNTSNYTFVITKATLNEFKAKCSESSISMSFALETLMRAYKGIDMS